MKISANFSYFSYFPSQAHKRPSLINNPEYHLDRIVIPVVVGSSPISHPKNSAVKTKGYTLLACSPFVFWKMNSKFWKISRESSLCLGVLLHVTKGKNG